MNLATLREAWGFKDAVEGCARHGISHVAPWRDQVAAVGLGDASRILEANGAIVTGYCRGGMFPAETAEGRQAALDDNRRAIDEAAAIGAQSLVLVVGGLPGKSKDLEAARAMVGEGLAA